MYTYIDFGRNVEIEDACGLITTTCSYRLCKTVVEARNLKAQFGGRMYRRVNGVEVEVA